MGKAIQKFFRRTDWFLLGLCVAASLFGIAMVNSTTQTLGASGYVMRQTVSLVLGLILFVVISFVDIDVIADHTVLLTVLGIGFILMLYPFGMNLSGNRSWLSIPGLPFNIQPAEYCKILYILIIAKITSKHQKRINAPGCILRLVIVTGLFVGLIVLVSSDAGVALIYVFTFVIMAVAGGLSGFWFLAAAVAIAIAAPVLWNTIIRDDQKARIQVLFDPSIDAEGQTTRYQIKRSLGAIRGGGLTGEGYRKGAYVQSNTLPARHTDFVFSSIAEELGYIGCAVVILLLVAIILRCIYVGVKSKNFFYRQVCIGVAGTLLFQVLINIGMCLGVMPVIGLTLPFFSYGGSSMMSLFISMGLVSSVRMHPAPESAERYLQVPILERA